MLLFIRERSEGHRASRAQFLDSLSLVLCLTQLKTRGKTFRPINDQRRTRPLFDCSISLGQEKKQNKTKKKKLKRKEVIGGNVSSPRMSLQTKTSNFGSRCWLAHIFGTPTTFLGQSLLLAEHCVLEASSLTYIIYIQTRVSTAFSTSYRDSSRTSTDHR